MVEFIQGINKDALTDEEYNEVLTEVSEKIITLLNVLNTIYTTISNMNLTFLMSSEQSNTLSYLKDVIKLFISYTSMLYNTSYALTYKSPSESVPLCESLIVDHSYIFTDALFYDTRVYITDSENYTIDEVRR